MLPIERDLQDVQHFHPGANATLSLYLDADFSRGGGRNLHAQLDGVLRPLRAIHADDDHASGELESAVALAVPRISSLSPTPRSVGVFVCPGRVFLRAIPLPDPVGSTARWGPEFYITPIVSAADEHERTVVAVVDKEHARVFRVFMGQIEEVAHLSNEMASSGQSGRAQRKTIRAVGGQTILAGYGERNLERRREWHIRKHLERTLAAMRPAGDRVLLGGGEETVFELLRLLPKRVRSRTHVIRGISVDDSVSAILARALDVQAEAEREHEEELVDNLTERDRARSVFGPAAVAEVVSDGRVHTLVYSAEAVLEGSECTGCKCLLPDAAAGPCPRCGCPLIPLPDLMERLVSRVIHDGGRVEEVRGRAQEKMHRMRDVAALLRYAPVLVDVAPSRVGGTGAGSLLSKVR